MTKEAKQAQILSAIKARGWFTREIYFAEANALNVAGLIKIGERFSVGGNRKLVWVAS